MDATSSAFLVLLAKLPLGDWLAIRDAITGGQLGCDLIPAYQAALEAADPARMDAGGLGGGDDDRRRTATIAWFAESRPDGEAITRRDVAALEILAERAAVELLMRDALADEQWRVLYAPFGCVLAIDDGAGA